MDSTKINDFVFDVKVKLLRMGKNQKWLIEQIREKGIFCDSGYLSKIFRGERKAKKVVQAIREILDMPEEGGDS